MIYLFVCLLSTPVLCFLQLEKVTFVCTTRVGSVFLAEGYTFCALVMPFMIGGNHKRHGQLKDIRLDKADNFGLGLGRCSFK